MKNLKFIVIFILFFSLLSVNTNADTWWNSSWQYRKPITIDNTQNLNALTDYQVAINLTYNSNIQPDFSDIRFTWYNSTDGTETEIPYWEETKINSAWDKVWIKVPYIPVSSTATIYVYYGNTSVVSSASNITNTFIREIDGVQPVKGSWHLDEGSGTTAYDTSGNSNTGTLTNGPAWVSGKFGKALSFDGVDDYIDIGNSSSLNFGTGNFSVEVWVKVLNGTTGSDIITKWSEEPENGYWLTIQDNKLYFGIDVSGDAPEVFTDPINLNQWYYVVGIRKGGNISIYLNGILASEDIGNAGDTSTIANLTIGKPKMMFTYFNGSIDEVRIYNRSLSDAEISDLYNYYGYTTTNYPGRVLVRKFTSPEPTYSIGSEETPLPPSPPQKGIPMFNAMFGLVMAGGSLLFVFRALLTEGSGEDKIKILVAGAIIFALAVAVIASMLI
jgi:hypothetical protein